MSRVDRKLLQQALANAQNISKTAASGQGFDHRGGIAVLGAQLATAGIGAYAQHKIRKQMAEKEATAQAAFGQQFPQFAGVAGQLSPQARENIIMQQALAGMKGPEIDNQLIETQNGYALIDKNSGSVKPVMNQNNKQVRPFREKSPTNNLTPAEEAVDKAFADDYTKFVQGEAADARKQISQLNEALDTLKTKNVTGPIIGITPRPLLNVFNKDAINTREAIEEVVQRNLRAVLGAQFTEKEGDRLIKRAFNPNLDEETNIKRISRLIEQIESAYNSKISAVNYYRKNGTLKGWEGKIPSINDFDFEEDNNQPNQPENTTSSSQNTQVIDFNDLPD